MYTAFLLGEYRIATRMTATPKSRITKVTGTKKLGMHGKLIPLDVCLVLRGVRSLTPSFSRAPQSWAKHESGHRKMLESSLRRSKVMLRRLTEQNCVGIDFVKVPIRCCERDFGWQSREALLSLRRESLALSHSSL